MSSEGNSLSSPVTQVLVTSSLMMVLELLLKMEIISRNTLVLQTRNQIFGTHNLNITNCTSQTAAVSFCHRLVVWCHSQVVLIMLFTGDSDRQLCWQLPDGPTSCSFRLGGCCQPDCQLESPVSDMIRLERTSC